MAVLEAFVYDPLINWRLLQPKSPDAASEDKSKQGTRDRSSSNADSSDESMSSRARLLKNLPYLFKLCSSYLF